MRRVRIEVNEIATKAMKCSFERSKTVLNRRATVQILGDQRAIGHGSRSGEAQRKPDDQCRGDLLALFSLSQSSIYSANRNNSG